MHRSTVDEPLDLRAFPLSAKLGDLVYDREPQPHLLKCNAFSGVLSKLSNSLIKPVP